MLNWHEIIQRNITGNYDKIRKTTQPLRDHFDINYFTYHRIDSKGNYTVLLDRPDFAEAYVDNKLFHVDPFLRHPSVFQSGLCDLQTNYTEEDYERAVGVAKPRFNLDMGVILIERSENAVEFFGFCDNYKNKKFNKLYLNHPHLLKGFANYFKKEMSLLLNDQEPGFLPVIKGKGFFCNTPVVPNLEIDANVGFLQDLGLGKYQRQVELLSKREQECLKYLLQGKTAKEIGAALSISYRTVESYIESIKNKLGCWSKNELCAIAQDLNRYGLL
jgi:DNA-binding CsgD family transcriptional regulator